MLSALIALGTLAACVTARWYLDRPERRDSEYAGGRIQFTKLWNEGAAFGLLVPKCLLMVLSALGLSVLWRQRREAPLGAGLVLGGGLSNLLERLRAGRVYDYLRFPKAPGKLKRYVYNLADLAIFLGGIGMILASLRKKK